MRIFNFKWARAAAEPRAGFHSVDVRFPRFPDIHPFFERELRRARRYGRPATLLVLGLVPVVQRPRHASANGGSQRSARHNGDSKEATRWIQPITKVGEVLETSIRETDLYAYVANTGDFVALLPEADGSSAQNALTRIREQWRPIDEFTLEVGAASFPIDALLFVDLLRAAQRARSVVPTEINAHSRDLKDAAHA
jgi:hypothetical protein